MLLPLPAGHGNHKEDSPFLGGADTAGKRSDFYDRNLALFEVALILFFVLVLLIMILIFLFSASHHQEELDIRPKVSSLLSRLVNYTNITQGAKEHEEEESSHSSRRKTPKVSWDGEFSSLCHFIGGHRGDGQVLGPPCDLPQIKLTCGFCMTTR